MGKEPRRWPIARIAIAAVIIFLAVIFTAWPLPARADGGPMVDPQLFAKLKEGQQVAVIQFQDTNTASVDLFISILDQTGESHEIVFFVPLGVKADGFGIREQDSLDFNDQYTKQLDMALFQDYRRDQDFVRMLFAGALLTNGVWLTPLWLPLLFTGCAEAPPPISTFETESSKISIFGIDESTDLEALISTTGLDPLVTETLSRLKGQQVAVIRFHDTNTASVDLFISILDQTGESHEIVFFVPLGVKADGFSVRDGGAGSTPFPAMLKSLSSE